MHETSFSWPLSPWMVIKKRCKDYLHAITDGIVLRKRDYEAELWGVLEGLSHAQRKGFSQIELCVDSEVVVNSIKGEGVGCASGCHLVKQIRKLLRGNWIIQIKHIYREANKCADLLANLGCDQHCSMVVYEQPPVAVLQALNADVLGVSTPRLISVSFFFLGFCALFPKK